MNTSLRMKLGILLEERYAIVVVILFVLAAVGAWGVYATHVAPETQTEERVVSAWSATGEFEHGATVVNASGPFDEGTEVTERSVYFTRPMPELDGTYFTRPMPELDGTFTYRYDAEDGAVDTHTELELVVRSVDSNGEEEEVYWQTTEPVNEVRTSDLEPGEVHEAPFSINVTETNDRIDSIEEDLGTSPGTTEVLVRARTTVEGTVHGEPIAETSGHTLRIEPSASTYRVGNPTSHEESYLSVEHLTVSADHGPLRNIGSVLLLVGSLFGFAAVAGVRHAGSLVSEKERQQVEHARERDEFDDWITRGTLPLEVLDQSKIDVESLEGLVDVAIDCDRRVIEETEVGSYYVVDSELLYRYEPSAHLSPRFSGDDETVGLNATDEISDDSSS